MNADDQDPTGPRGFLTRYRLQIIGFVAWWVLNGVPAAILLVDADASSGGLLLIPWGFVFFGNLAALIILAAIKATRKVAFGVLLAMALNLFVSLVLGAFLYAMCFIPFYVQFGS